MEVTYEVKIEESKKASSRQDSNPGHHWLELSVLCHWATTARPLTILSMYCTGGTECLSHTPGSYSVCAIRTLLDMERYQIQNNKHQLLHAWKISSYYVYVNIMHKIMYILHNQFVYSSYRPLCFFFPLKLHDISIHQNFFLHNFSCASNSLWLVCYWGKEGCSVILSWCILWSCHYRDWRPDCTLNCHLQMLMSIQWD